MIYKKVKEIIKKKENKQKEDKEEKRIIYMKAKRLGLKPSQYVRLVSLNAEVNTK